MAVETCVSQLKQMSYSLTARLPSDLADWLEDEAKKTGMTRGQIIRIELERARRSSDKPFMRLAGVLGDGPRDLSMRKGFSKK